MRTSARMTGAAVAVAAVGLLVSGCGSGGDDGGSGGGGSEAKPSAGASAGQGSQEPADDAPVTLSGVWTMKVDGEDFVLTIAGDGVTLLRDGKTCTGRATGGGDQQTLTLKCPGGIGEERTNGTVEKLEAKSLKVAWNGGDTDTYGKVADAPKTLPKDPKELEKLLPSGG
ncbi:hypothetical protein [Streptomyces daliensis]|uniref:Lipoprotein n=1 Tax=Streptomyces daliensis TaxID=299421 RepID=A0A8T4IJM8_9ACTN|nr:hypothetical protein [Streptomyces daliensis]